MSDDPGLEIAKEAAGAAASELVRPGADLIANIIGVLGGDALKDYREQRAERRKARHAELSGNALKLLQDRGVHEPAEPNAAAVDELATAAQDEPRKELQELWARLLAAMFDPGRATSFRREFIEIAKQLEPIDAAALPLLTEAVPSGRTRKGLIAQQLGVSLDESECSCLSLIRLGLGAKHQSNYQMSPHEPIVTALGRRFLAAVE
jgi:hypothetical protein